VTSLGLLYSDGAFAYFEIAFRLVLAAALAALLGWDREDKDRPAGLRTYMLVALAAAVFTILTFQIYDVTIAANPDGNADPIRIIEAVTAGVAFLAAGTIIQGRSSVKGLTTGAGMWMAGALGLAVGAGHYALAVLAAVLSFIVLRFIQILSKGPDEAARSLLIVESPEDEGSG
jgi:putative Mg2+ transporter-C (MgtC) family protein